MEFFIFLHFLLAPARFFLVPSPVSLYLVVVSRSYLPFTVNMLIYKVRLCFLSAPRSVSPGACVYVELYAD